MCETWWIQIASLFIIYKCVPASTFHTWFLNTIVFYLFYSIKYSLVLHIIILNDVAIAQMRLFVLYLSRYLAWPELIFCRILIIVPADLSLKSIKISLNELNKYLQITDFCQFVVIVFFLLSFVSRLFSLLSFLVELRNLVCEYGADMTGLKNPSLNYHFQT